MKDADVIIIGSGAGGLSAALCLAKAGKKVIVAEQHYVPGGWCQSFYMDGHRFSPGVHYIGELGTGQRSARLYEGLGIANDIAFFQMNPKAYDHCYIGENRFDIPAGKERLIERLQQQFPHERRRIKRYVNLLEMVHEEIHMIKDFETVSDFILGPIRTRHVGRLAIFSLQRVSNWYLKDPFLKAILSVQCGNHGLPPAKASFALQSALAMHYMNGGFYPVGGAGAITKAFTNAIKEKGGKILTGKKVENIIIKNKNGHPVATGVRLADGTEMTADKIISNADPHKTYLKLVGEDYLPKRLKRKLKKTTYSIAALSMFLVIEADLKTFGFDSGNIWYASGNDLNAVYDELINEHPLAKQFFPGLFIGSSTLKDPTGFDGHHHTLEVVTFTSYRYFQPFENSHTGQRPSDYEALKEQIAEKMLRTLERLFPGICHAIVKWEMGTPLTNSYYVESTFGNSYGTEKILSQLAFLGFQAKSPIENLYLTGASTLSHGVTGATSSGVATAARVLGLKNQDELLPYQADQQVRVYPAEDPGSWPEWINRKISTRRKKDKAAANKTIPMPE